MPPAICITALNHILVIWQSTLLLPAPGLARKNNCVCTESADLAQKLIKYNIYCNEIEIGGGGADTKYRPNSANKSLNCVDVKNKSASQRPLQNSTTQQRLSWCSLYLLTHYHHTFALPNQSLKILPKMYVTCRTSSISQQLDRMKMQSYTNIKYKLNHWILRWEYLMKFAIARLLHSFHSRSKLKEEEEKQHRKTKYKINKRRTGRYYPTILYARHLTNNTKILTHKHTDTH